MDEPLCDWPACTLHAFHGGAHGIPSAEPTPIEKEDTMPRPTVVPQMGFDEQIIEDAEVESALEEREKRKASLAAVRKVYDGAHEAAAASA